MDYALQEKTTTEQNTQHIIQSAPSALPEIDLESLPYSVRHLIRNGASKGQRSEAIASILAALIKAKVPDKVIFQIFNTHKIGAKYRKKGQGKERWLQAEINRSRKFVSKKGQKKKPRGVSLGMAKEQFEHDKDIEFIWGKVIPKSMPIMLAGREGSGKTSNALQIAKEIVEANDTGYVVWLATEGAVLDTIDKADKLGIHNSRFVFAEKSDGTYKFEFSRHDDRKELDTLLDELPGPILAVFIDSIRGMSKYGDSDDENGRIMHSLNAIICDKHKSALIYIDHHKKGAASNLLDKTAGSTSKTSAVRLVLAIEKKSKLVRTIKPAKVNLFKEIPELESIQVGHEIHIRELTKFTDSSMTDKCEMWLTELMSNEREIHASDVFRMAEMEGFSTGIVKKAKKELPIKTKQVGKRWKWFWELTGG
jgi:archaellum biogenesis ATPase FlaH